MQRCCLVLLHNVAIVVLVPSRVWLSVLEARWEDDCIRWDHELVWRQLRLILS